MRPSPDVEIIPYNPWRVSVGTHRGRQRVLTDQGRDRGDAQRDTETFPRRVRTDQDGDQGEAQGHTQASREGRGNVDTDNDAEVEVVGTGVARAGSFEDEATRLRQRYRRHVREHRSLEARPSARSRENNGGPGPAPDNVVAQQRARLERLSASTGHQGPGANDRVQEIAQDEGAADQRGTGVADPGPADVRADDTSNDPDRRVRVS